MNRTSKFKKRAPLIISGALGLLFLLGVVWMIRGVMGSKTEKPSRMVQNITLIRPPPPPPDVPPPPPPDKLDEPLPQNEPDPTPDNTPTPSEQLGLDAEGAAGDDGFGLAARKGGGDLIGSGGAAFAWYTGRLKDVVSEKLTDNAALRSKKFIITIRVWIDTDGRIKDLRLATGSGNRDLDSLITSSLTGIGRMSEPPPIEMPQPISLRIVSRTS